jgi:5-formyltetrahydrofolate cyclo-ligase
MLYHISKTIRDGSSKRLRAKYKALRSQLSENDVETMSLAITNLLHFLFGRNVFPHFSTHYRTKVDTELILHLLSGKDKVIISKADFNSLKMTHFLLTDNTKIKKNEHNIPEPVDGIEVPSHKIEVVFVPLLAYDKQGQRVGYGKGFTISS